MRRGEIWFASTPGGDRPVLVLTRDPVAERTGSVVVAARTRTVLVSELDLDPETDGMPTACVINFDNLHTLPRDGFRRHVTTLGPGPDGRRLSHVVRGNGLLTRSDPVHLDAGKARPRRPGDAGESDGTVDSERWQGSES